MITMTTTYAHTYEILHPQLSHPVYLDSHVPRTDRALRAWVTGAILRQTGEMLDPKGFHIQEVEYAED